MLKTAHLLVGMYYSAQFDELEAYEKHLRKVLQELLAQDETLFTSRFGSDLVEHLRGTSD